MKRDNEKSHLKMGINNNNIIVKVKGVERDYLFWKTELEPVSKMSSSLKKIRRWTKSQKRRFISKLQLCCDLCFGFLVT
jgi:hypothetical protein